MQQSNLFSAKQLQTDTAKANHAPDAVEKYDTSRDALLGGVRLVETGIVKDRRWEFDDRPPKVSKPSEVADLLHDLIGDADREHLVVVMLATDKSVQSLHVAHRGSLKKTLVDPKQVFKPAILQNACSIVVAHNHPSGNPEPSKADIKMTRELDEAGDLLDIPVEDSIIVTPYGDHTSLARRGVL